MDRETQYREFSETCQSKGLPVPTIKEWEDFVKARDRMKPHDGYVRKMLGFANALAKDLPVPLRITIFAPPMGTGLGLLRIGLERFGAHKLTLPEVVVSESSVLGPEPKEILLRNKDYLVSNPPPVEFIDGNHFCLAGAENDWSIDDVRKVSSCVAQCLIRKLGMRA